MPLRKTVFLFLVTVVFTGINFSAHASLLFNVSPEFEVWDYGASNGKASGSGLLYGGGVGYFERNYYGGVNVRTGSYDSRSQFEMDVLAGYKLDYFYNVFAGMRIIRASYEEQIGGTINTNDRALNTLGVGISSSYNLSRQFVVSGSTSSNILFASLENSSGDSGNGIGMSWAVNANLDYRISSPLSLSLGYRYQFASAGLQMSHHEEALVDMYHRFALSMNYVLR